MLLTLTVFTPIIGMLAAAACIAPGYIWPSEFLQFDTLAYHLQLPKEWLADGALRFNDEELARRFEASAD